MPNRAREKGDRFERALVAMHRDAGLPCQRVPLSGAAGGSFAGDLRIGAYKAEAKVRRGADGFKTIANWLGKNHLLFLKRDRKDPLVVMPFDLYADLMSLNLAQAAGEITNTPGSLLPAAAPACASSPAPEADLEEISTEKETLR